MSDSTSHWYRSLSPEIRQQIKKLHRVQPYWNLVGLLFILLWIGAGVMIMTFPS